MEDQALEPEQVTEARQEAQQLQELLVSPGWAVLVRVANAQINNRRGPYMRAPLKSDTMLEQQWTLGEASGIEIFIRLPDTIVESHKSIIEENDRAVAESQQTE